MTQINTAWFARRDRLQLPALAFCYSFHTRLHECVGAPSCAWFRHQMSDSNPNRPGIVRLPSGRQFGRSQHCPGFTPGDHIIAANGSFGLPSTTAGRHSVSTRAAVEQADGRKIRSGRCYPDALHTRNRETHPDTVPEHSLEANLWFPCASQPVSNFRVVCQLLSQRNPQSPQLRSDPRAPCIISAPAEVPHT